MLVTNYIHQSRDAQVYRPRGCDPP